MGIHLHADGKLGDFFVKLGAFSWRTKEAQRSQIDLKLILFKMKSSL